MVLQETELFSEPQLKHFDYNENMYENNFLVTLMKR